MASFVLTMSHSQSERYIPVVVVTADDIDSLPTDARPYDPNNELHVSLADGVMATANEDPAHGTVSYAAHSIGGYREGSE